MPKSDHWSQGVSSHTDRAGKEDSVRVEMHRDSTFSSWKEKCDTLKMAVRIRQEKIKKSRARRWSQGALKRKANNGKGYMIIGEKYSRIVQKNYPSANFRNNFNYLTLNALIL